jgi:uncharacterized protein YtpQ (UPF0354 family)
VQGAYYTCRYGTGLHEVGEVFSMSFMPKEPEAFAEQVVALLHRLHPEYVVELVGPREMIINGRRLDLDNLYRLVLQNPDTGLQITEQYLENLFSGEAAGAESLPFDMARRMIMPRIHPEHVFNHLDEEQVACVPYVNGTVILFVIDLPQMTVSITTEQMVRWNVTPDELDEIARGNLHATSEHMEMQVIDSDDGGRAAIFSQRDGYDAARLLLGDLYHKLAPELGGNFLVATPARDVFVAMSADPDEFIQRVRNRVGEDFVKLPYPITTDLFLVTRDGVAGTRDAA